MEGWRKNGGNPEGKSMRNSTCFLPNLFATFGSFGTGELPLGVMAAFQGAIYSLMSSIVPASMHIWLSFPSPSYPLAWSFRHTPYHHRLIIHHITFLFAIDTLPPANRHAGK